MKSFNEQINDICKSTMVRREKVNALIKLGLRENEISVILPKELHQTHKYTFGVEIECVMNRSRFENVASVPYHFEHYNHTDNRVYFKFTTDGSIRRNYDDTDFESSPIECVSPILSSSDGFSKLKACCNSLNEAGAYVNRSTGMHVHIGAGNLTSQQYVNVFKNYQKLESVIDSFLAPSRTNGEYCVSMRGLDFSSCYSISDVCDVIPSRYYKVNAKAFAAHGTIEFRQHQGTTNYTKIKNWVKFCAKLVAYSANHVFENEITCVNDIPFLTSAEKKYFNERVEVFRVGVAA